MRKSVHNEEDVMMEFIKREQERVEYISRRMEIHENTNNTVDNQTSILGIIY